MTLAFHHQRSVGSQMGSAADIRSLADVRTRRYSDSYTDFDDENVLSNDNSLTRCVTSTLNSADSHEAPSAFLPNCPDLRYSNKASLLSNEFTADKSLNTTDGNNTTIDSALYLNCSERDDGEASSTAEGGDLIDAFAFASRMFYAQDEYASPSIPHATVTGIIKSSQAKVVHNRVVLKGSTSVEESCLLDLDSGRISGELGRGASGVCNDKRREHSKRTTDGCVPEKTFSTISFSYDHYPHTVTMLANRYNSIRQACLAPMQQNVKRIALVPSNYAAILRDATNMPTVTERVYALKDALNSTQMPVRVEEVRFPRLLGKHTNALAAVVQSALCEAAVTTAEEEAERRRRAAVRAAAAAAANQPQLPRRRGRPRRVSRRSSSGSDDSLTRRQQLTNMCAKSLLPAMNARHRISIVRTPLIDQPLKRQPPDANGFFTVSTSLAKNNQWLLMTSSKNASNSAVLNASETDDFQMRFGLPSINDRRKASSRVSEAWSLRSAGTIDVSLAEADDAAVLAASTPDTSFAADGTLRADSCGVSVNSHSGSNSDKTSNQKVAGAECTSPPLTANRSKFLPLSSRRTVANEVCDSSSGWDDSYYSAALDEVMADLEPRSSAPPPAEIPAAPTAVATTGSTVSQHPSSFLYPQPFYPHPVPHPSHHLFYPSFMPYGYYPMMTMPYPTSTNTATMPMPSLTTSASQTFTTCTTVVSTTCNNEVEKTVDQNGSAKATVLVKEPQSKRATNVDRAAESVPPKNTSEANVDGAAEAVPPNNSSFASLNASFASPVAAAVTPTDDSTRCICACDCRVCADNTAEIKRLEDELSKARADSIRLRHAHHAVRNNTISSECTFRIAVAASSEARATGVGVSAAPPPEIASIMMAIFGASATAKKKAPLVEKTATIDRNKTDKVECRIVKLDDQLVKKIVENIRSESPERIVKLKPQGMSMTKTAVKAERPQSKTGSPAKPSTANSYASPLRKRMLQRKNKPEEPSNPLQVKSKLTVSVLPKNLLTKTNVTAGVCGAKKIDQKLVVTATISADTNESGISSSFKSGQYVRKVVIDDEVQAITNNRATVVSDHDCVSDTRSVVKCNGQTTTEDNDSDSDQMEALGELLSPITTSSCIDNAEVKADKMTKRAIKKHWREDEIVLSDDNEMCSAGDDDDVEWMPNRRCAGGGGNLRKSHVKEKEQNSRKTAAKRNAPTKNVTTKRTRRRNKLVVDVDTLSLGWSDLSADAPPELDAAGEAEVIILSNDEAEGSAAKTQRNASRLKQENAADTNANKQRTRIAASNARVTFTRIAEEMDDNVAPQLAPEATEYVRRKLAVVRDRYVPFRPKQRQPKRKSPPQQTSALCNEVPSAFGDVNTECDDERVKRSRVAHWVEQSVRRKKHEESPS